MGKISFENLTWSWTINDLPLLDQLTSPLFFSSLTSCQSFDKKAGVGPDVDPPDETSVSSEWSKMFYEPNSQNYDYGQTALTIKRRSVNDISRRSSWLCFILIIGIFLAIAFKHTLELVNMRVHFQTENRQNQITMPFEVNVVSFTKSDKNY